MVLATLAAVALAVTAPPTPDNAVCTRVKRCNGIMCKEICAEGSVQLDPWADSALAFQRALQLHEPLYKTTLIGTHNSAISQAYGFGIEQDYLEGLLGHPLYAGDDLGEGVCQSLSVVDQLRMGLRHIEIDITSGYFEIFDPTLPRVNQIFVCHSPFPLSPQLVAEVDIKAAEQHISLGWDPKNLSCEHTNVPLRVMLESIKGWLDANPDEIVMLYFDTKPLTVELPSQAKAMYDVMRGVFGDTIWTVGDGNPLNHSRAELLARGKRVICEDHDDGYNHPAGGGDILVFTPDLFKHQFGTSDLTPFPNCSISGDTQWYGTELVRALTAATPDFVQRASDCAVNIVSPDYIMPDNMRSFVWSVAENTTLTADGCVARLPSGRWATRDCAQPLKGACRSQADDHKWALTAQPVAWKAFSSTDCPAGFTAAPPANGFTNRLLGHVTPADAAVWLYVTPTGTQPSP
mmetsp:Transcript_5083/g.15485  ORF Transcript_5083/g.15485 Transcript_5083/m.15485 type:complete len:462 (+) Transcript_5083:1-1386(+)